MVPEAHSLHFIIVDDDPISNMLCRKLIFNTNRNYSSTSFTKPEDGLNYILKLSKSESTENYVLLLDINMPSMNGWEFLQQVEKIKPTLRNHMHIYLLSSSVNPRDKEKALAIPLIEAYLEKPLSKEFLMALSGEGVC